MRNQRILIAVPVYQTCMTETMQSIYQLKIPSGVNADLHFMKGYTVDQARNLLASKSVTEKYDYTFFVDADVIIPDNALTRLLKLDTDIATGWYIKKLPGQFVPELFIEENGCLANVKGVDPAAIIPVKACGFGCTLVKNEVFLKLGRGNWFEYIQNSHGLIASEDITFCTKAEAKGFKIIVDGSLRCGHIGQTVF